MDPSLLPAEAINSVQAGIALYGPFALLPLMLVEGPLMSIAIGFLVGSGTFKLWSAALIYLIADAIVTHIYYFAGRGGSSVLEKIKQNFNLKVSSTTTLGRLKENINRDLKKNFEPTFAFAKFIPIPYSTITALVLSGSMGIEYRRFIRLNLLLIPIQGSIFIGIGYLLAQGILFRPTIGRGLGLVAVIIIIGLAYHYRYRWLGGDKKIRDSENS
jgi:membrane protein DedA with SNARE-associated domain